MVIAGTPCASWSRMGARKKWAAEATGPFLIWALRVKQASPAIIVHECTAEFDEKLLHQIFGDCYDIQSHVFSPSQLGWPTTRQRKYSILIHNTRFCRTHSFTEYRYRDLFHRSIRMTGHDFWCAPEAVVLAYAGELAGNIGCGGLPASFAVSDFRTVLPESSRQRLLAFEKQCRKENKPLDGIVNLCQNASFMRGHSVHVPCLMTRSSSLWSMVHNRLLTPGEHLVVMGIPLFAPDRTPEQRFAIEKLFWESLEEPGEEATDGSRRLTSKDFCLLAGNSMSGIAIGSVMLFALCTARAVPSQGQSDPV